MKFSEKYELFESLTTGAIETFVANDKVRGERVLVHIVECGPQEADQTTAEWVLESFRRCAPEPPGPVLETGKYSGAKYGYVVTRPADDVVIKAWVRRYELQADETRETRVHSLNREVAIPPAAAPTASKDPVQSAGTMTQLFRDFDSLAKAKAPEGLVSDNAAPARSAPSTNLPGESGLHTAVPWDPANARAAGVPKETPPAFVPASPRPIVQEPPARDLQSGAKPGEFTSFFQGPFRGDKPADMPAFASEPIEPPKKSVGEFTAVFGQASSPTPAATTPPKGLAEPSFTGIFKDMESAKAPLRETPVVQNVVVPPPLQPLPSVAPVNIPPTPDPVFVAPPVPVVTPAPTIPPLPSRPAARPVVQPTSLPGDGATGAFRRPSAEPAPAPMEVPSGPSAYTQIISRSKLPNAEAGEAAHPAGAAPGKPAAPPLPKIPAAAPPMPKMPSAPPMPKVAAPKVPKAPKVDVPAPPPVSLLPVVITLGVLFVLAVILVLFFVMRH